jgi:hypothetical protein
MHPLAAALPLGGGLVGLHCCTPGLAGGKDVVKSRRGLVVGDVVSLQGLICLGQSCRCWSPGHDLCNLAGLPHPRGELPCLAGNPPFKSPPPGQHGLGPCPIILHIRGRGRFLLKKLLEFGPGCIIVPEVLEPDAAQPRALVSLGPREKVEYHWAMI